MVVDVGRRVRQAQRIQRERRRMQMTQAELAAAVRVLADELQEPVLASVDQTLVSKWEATGGRYVSRLYDAQIAALSIVFGVSADYLLGLDDSLGGRE